MNIVKIYSQLRAKAEQLGRFGGYRRGRRTGDDLYDKFLREVRLHRAALRMFSAAEQKEWNQHLSEFNGDLAVHSHRQAIEQRVQSRRLNTNPGLQKALKLHQATHMMSRARRLSAVAVVCETLRKQLKKPKLKAVIKQLEKDFPELPVVMPDTLRKDLHKLKVACRSS